MADVACDTPRLLAGWHVEATCPECGDVLEHVADGRPTGFVSRALACCTGCHRQWMVEMTLTAVHRQLAGPQQP